jgi:hypothetical protein
LEEELGFLCQSLVFVASNDERRILYPILGETWNKVRQDAGIWWQSDPRNGNLYVHGYHPNAALRFWDDMLGATVGLARTHLPAFE